MRHNLTHDFGRFLPLVAGIRLVVGTVGVADMARERAAPIVDPVTVAVVPLIDLAMGLIAGLCPSWRAVRIGPVEPPRR